MFTFSFTRLSRGIVAAGALLCVSLPLSATSFFYDFSGPNTNIGNTHTYIDNGISVVATGWKSPGSTADLYAKNLGGDELGLGLVLTNNPTNEITGTGFIQLNLHNLEVIGADNYKIGINSSTSPDAWKVFGSTTTGVLGTTLLASGTAEGQFSFNPGIFNLISIEASHGDVLLASLAASHSVEAPEPGTLLVLSSGLLIGAIRKRMGRSKSVVSES